MFDFSSNHFQKAKAILTLLQDDRCNGCATQETGAFLCCVANTRSVTIDIDGGATKGSDPSPVVMRLTNIEEI
jgi:hypothetical protein